MARPHLNRLRKKLESLQTEVEGTLCDPAVTRNPRYFRRMFDDLKELVDQVEDDFPVSAAQSNPTPQYREELERARDELDEDLDDLDASCTESSQSPDTESTASSATSNSSSSSSSSSSSNSSSSSSSNSSSSSSSGV